MLESFFLSFCHSKLVFWREIIDKPHADKPIDARERHARLEAAIVRTDGGRQRTTRLLCSSHGQAAVIDVLFRLFSRPPRVSLRPALACTRDHVVPNRPISLPKRKTTRFLDKFRRLIMSANGEGSGANGHISADCSICGDRYEEAKNFANSFLGLPENTT